MNHTSFQIAFYVLRAMHPGITLSAGWALAQAVHESANFTSPVYLRTNNFLGMKAPSVRATTATNKGGKGYAVYSSTLDCLRDYFLWLVARKVVTDADFVKLISTPAARGGYAEDEKYYPKVLAAYKSLSAGFISPVGVAVVAVAVIVLPLALLAVYS